MTVIGQYSWPRISLKGIVHGAAAAAARHGSQPSHASASNADRPTYTTETPRWMEGKGPPTRPAGWPAGRVVFLGAAWHDHPVILPASERRRQTQMVSDPLRTAVGPAGVCCSPPTRPPTGDVCFLSTPNSILVSVRGRWRRRAASSPRRGNGLSYWNWVWSSAVDLTRVYDILTLNISISLPTTTTSTRKKTRWP